MNRAIRMNRAAVAHHTESLFFMWLLTNGLERCQKFIPVRIALFHSIYFPLMLRAIRMAGLFAKTLGAIPRGEIEPTARHGAPYGSNLPPIMFCVVTLPCASRMEMF